MFISFKNFVEKKDQVFLDEQLSKEEKDKIKDMLEGNGFVFFFTRNGELFGAPEESRLTFAKMKNPADEDDWGNSDKWAKEANFVAASLDSAVNGEKKRSIFSHDDLKKIKIVDKDDAYKELLKKADPKKKDKMKTALRHKDPDNDEKTPHNMNVIGDE